MASGTRDRADIGVALSGGGHRAALFTAGALMALVDMGANIRVVSVASVSGGSITNGLIATGCDFATTGRAELETALAPGIKAFTHDGLFFPGRPTNGYVARALGLAGLTVGAVLGWMLGSLTLIGPEVTDWACLALAVAVVLATPLFARSMSPRFGLAVVLGVSLGLFGA